MKISFVAKKSSDGVSDKEMLDGRELESVYEPLKQKLSKNLQKQESIISEIQVGFTQMFHCVIHCHTSL